MTFWSDPNVNPYRKYRFKLSLGGDYFWYANTVTLPSFDVSSGEYNIGNFKYQIPGITTWNDVEIGMVDVQDTTDKRVDKFLKGMDWKAAQTTKGLKKDTGKKLTIELLAATGSVGKTYTLVNSFVKSVNYGDLDYSSDDFVTVSITLGYDYATKE